MNFALILFILTVITGIFGFLSARYFCRSAAGRPRKPRQLLKLPTARRSDAAMLLSAKICAV